MCWIFEMSFLSQPLALRSLFLTLLCLVTKMFWLPSKWLGFSILAITNYRTLLGGILILFLGKKSFKPLAKRRLRITEEWKNRFLNIFSPWKLVYNPILLHVSWLRKSLLLGASLGNIRKSRLKGPLSGPKISGFNLEIKDPNSSLIS